MPTIKIFIPYILRGERKAEEKNEKGGLSNKQERELAFFFLLITRVYCHFCSFFLVHVSFDYFTFVVVLAFSSCPFTLCLVAVCLFTPAVMLFVRHFIHHFTDIINQ